jgi:8-oxo-dGTP pyrophosphatase MutT (NUDIX family)
MANAYVFPGGRLEASDSGDGLQRFVDGDRHALRELMDGTDGADAEGHALAAIRETFEEAGFLLALEDGCVLRVDNAEKVSRYQAHRDALNKGEATLAEILRKEGLRISLDSVRYVAHWITPVVEKRRYSARFFVAIAPEGQAGSHDEIETTDSCWLSADDALQAYERGGFSLAPPTWHILRTLAAYSCVEDVLAWGRSVSEVVPIMPHFIVEEGETVLALPGDDQHPDSAGSNKHHRIVLRNGRWTQA